MIFKWDSHDITEILLKVVLNIITLFKWAVRITLLIFIPAYVCEENLYVIFCKKDKFLMQEVLWKIIFFNLLKC